MALYGLVRDLVFGAKLRGWADLAGIQYASLRNEAALDGLGTAGDLRADIIVVDLTVDDTLLQKIAGFISGPSPLLKSDQVIGFFPHVEEALADKGKLIGCGMVVRRSSLEKVVRARLHVP